MTDLDIAPLRPLQLGVVTGTEVAWVAPADPVRVRGADLGEVARRASAARAAITPTRMSWSTSTS